jgi:hypothetical protein
MNYEILENWDYEINNSPDNRLHFYYFNDTALLKKPILSICDQVYPIKHLSYSRDELDQMKWFVTLK